MKKGGTNRFPGTGESRLKLFVGGGSLTELALHVSASNNGPGALFPFLRMLAKRRLRVQNGGWHHLAHSFHRIDCCRTPVRHCDSVVELAK